MALKDKNVKILAVAVGPLVDPGILDKKIPDGTVVNTTTTTDPKDIADKIIDIVGKGINHIFLFRTLLNVMHTKAGRFFVTS
jgi:hypothetical protein